MAHSLGFYGDGISFRVVFGQSFKFSLSWWRAHHSAKMDASERDSGKWTDTRCLLSTFPKCWGPAPADPGYSKERRHNDTILMAESEEELESLLVKVKRRVKKLA